METQVLELLRGCKATRAIDETLVEAGKLIMILEAARLSASCANNQPWRFLMLSEPAALEICRGQYFA